MPVPVVSEETVHQRLKDLGYESSEHKTDTGILWKHKETGKYIQVPYALDGFYPDFILADLEDIIGKINPWVAFKERQQRGRERTKRKKP